MLPDSPSLLPAAILLVDNNQANVSILFDYLQANGFRVLVARDGESAIQRARLAQPDLILLDVLMPGINGFETCRRLKADPATRDCPVIFMTGLGDTENKLEGFEAGGVDYITKPLQLPEVLQRVSTHLRLRRLVRELQTANQALLRRAHYLEINRQLGGHITAILDLEDLLPQVVQLIRRQFGYAFVGTWLLNERRDRLVLQAGDGQADCFGEAETSLLLSGDSLPVTVFLSGQPGQTDTRLDMPLRISNRPLGVLDICTGTPGVPEPEEGALLQILANQVAVAVRNAQSYRLEKRRLAEIEAANKELEMFSYSVSHDLRAPLRAISGYSRIIQQDYLERLPEDGRKLFDNVIASVNRMNKLIDDLLAFSRYSRYPLEKSELQPAEIVHQVLAELAGEAAGRQVQITVGDLPACRADPAMLKLVWANLVANALKFSRPRPVADIEIGSLPVQDGQPVTYYIKDNGVGFDMRYADKLFGAFQRMHSEREFEGSGVGLAVVQRIIARHGGRVWADARPGQGARFFFTLE